MTGTQYQSTSRRTLDPDASLCMAGLGLAGESGEVVELLKKALFHGHDMDRDALTKELGDVLWYVAAVASLTGLNLDIIMQANIEKLEKRYPDGFVKGAR